MTTIQIRALIFQDAGFWCAQCLERDIAVQSHSQKELMGELTKLLSSYIEVAIKEGKEPFVDLPRAPEHFFKMFNQSREMDAAPIKVLESGEAPQIVPTFRVFQPA